MNLDYLESVKAQLQHYKSLGEKTFEQISEEHFFWKPTEASNSIWVLVKHLAGNMQARFTNFFTTDGEAGRQRDAEFVEEQVSREQLMAIWEKGWTQLFTTLDELTQADLTKEVSLKNKGLSVVDFINQAVFHYLYHVGQIVYIGKMAVNTDWVMLWGPKKKK